MKNYRVTVYDKNGLMLEYKLASGATEAENLALEVCKKTRRDDQVYIEYFDTTDQKTAYLNYGGFGRVATNWNRVKR